MSSSYNSKSSDPNVFIDDEYIKEGLDNSLKNSSNKHYLLDVITKAKEKKGIAAVEALSLFYSNDRDIWNIVFNLAKQIKQEIYGNRIVLFAPLYISNYCVNSCVYCPYHVVNKKIQRVKLTQEQIYAETQALIKMGHKRLALEAGEDDVNNPIDYIIDSIKTIYSAPDKTNSIRRVNVNIAATTVENYKKLKDAGIGTYILFQETYNKKRYELMHPLGPKSNYDYHTTAMDRAMQAGIDDVGIGTLFGLNKADYELFAILLHAKHLEDTFNVGPHTVSVPRIRRAEDIDPAKFPDAVGDADFEKIIALIRIALPYTGMIMSTRESPEFRKKALEIGITQISGGSKTSVGGYSKNINSTKTAQFDVSDNRTLDEVVEFLLEHSYIPSFCTACYRQGRTGDRFMSLAKSGKIQDCCSPNALMTLAEYSRDYASDKTKRLCKKVISNEIQKITNNKIKTTTELYLEKINQGESDFRF